MTLIKQRSKLELTDLQINITSNLQKQIDEYCNLTNMDDVSYFFTGSADYIVSKDKIWQQYVKAQKRSTKSWLEIAHNATTTVSDNP